MECLTTVERMRRGRQGKGGEAAATLPFSLAVHLGLLSKGLVHRIFANHSTGCSGKKCLKQDLIFRIPEDIMKEKRGIQL